MKTNFLFSIVLSLVIFISNAISESEVNFYQNDQLTAGNKDRFKYPSYPSKTRKKRAEKWPEGRIYLRDGWDVLSQKRSNECVAQAYKDEEYWRSRETSGRVDYSMITSKSSLHELLKKQMQISGSLSAGVLGLSGKFISDALTEITVSEESVTMVAYIYLPKYTVWMQDIEKRVVPNYPQTNLEFRERFGDQFLQGALIGGMVYYYFSFSQKTSTILKKKEMEAAANAKVKWIVKGEGNLSDKEKEDLEKAEQYTECHMGFIKNLANDEGIHPVQNYEEFIAQVDQVTKNCSDPLNLAILSQNLVAYPNDWIPGNQAYDIALRTDKLEITLEHIADFNLLIDRIPFLKVSTQANGTVTAYDLTDDRALNNDNVSSEANTAQYFYYNRDDIYSNLERCKASINDLNNDSPYSPDDIHYWFPHASDLTDMTSNSYIFPDVLE